MTSGESHGPQLTAILSGMPAGLELIAADIDGDLKRRQGGYGRGGRMKIESDRVRFVSGVRHGATLGSPITMIVENKDWKNWDKIMAAERPKAARPEAGSGSEAPQTGDRPEAGAATGAEAGDAAPEPEEKYDHAGAGPKGEGPQRKITRPRPGHADLAGIQKFAHVDARNILERASARATTTQVAVGAVCKKFLAEFGIRVISHVTNLGGIEADSTGLTYEEIYERAEASRVRIADPSKEQAMIDLIDACKTEKDTVGGIFEVIATGLPAGLGNVMNWDEKLDGKIGQLMMSLQAIKGVEIGGGFRTAVLRGSEVHDAIYYADESADGKAGAGAEAGAGAGENAGATPDRNPGGRGPSGGYYRKTNNAGGLEGGMTNGEPLVVRVAKKPISTLMRPIASVDIETHEASDSSKERSDVCALPAAAVIGEALVAYALAWAMLGKFGGDSMVEIRHAYDGYVARLG